MTQQAKAAVEPDDLVRCVRHAVRGGSCPLAVTRVQCYVHTSITHTHTHSGTSTHTDIQINYINKIKIKKTEVKV